MEGEKTQKKEKTIMFYFVTITRNGQLFYVVSPKWGKYELSPTKDKNTYLWTSQENAEIGVKHLIQEGDKVEYHRTYRS